MRFLSIFFLSKTQEKSSKRRLKAAKICSTLLLKEIDVLHFFKSHRLYMTMVVSPIFKVKIEYAWINEDYN